MRGLGDVDIGLKLFGAFDVGPARLQRPGLRGIPGETDGGGVEFAGFDVVARLVWLAAAEAGGFELERIVDQPAVRTPKVMWVESIQ